MRAGGLESRIPLSRWGESKGVSRDSEKRGQIAGSGRMRLEQQLVEAVVAAQALRESSQWATADLDEIWSEEALTAVVLPRWHINLSIGRALGVKLGSLKERTAIAERRFATRSLRNPGSESSSCLPARGLYTRRPAC